MSNRIDTAVLVRCPVSRDKVRMIASTVRTTLRVCARWVLDFAGLQTRPAFRMRNQFPGTNY